VCNPKDIQGFAPFVSIMRAPSSGPAWANPNPSVVETTEMMHDPVENELLAPYSTLDEPVMETIMRDVRAVGQKLSVVMLPLDRSAPFGYTGLSSQEPEPSESLGQNQKKVIDQLRDWDLW
jgi:hypothetical protein